MTGDVDHVPCDVPGDLAVDPADADVEDGGPGLDQVPGDQTRDPRGRDDDVGAADVLSA